MLKSAVGRLSSAVTVLEINAFYNVIITVLLLIFYCLLSPLCEADPAIHISDPGHLHIPWHGYTRLMLQLFDAA